MPLPGLQGSRLPVASASTPASLGAFASAFASSAASAASGSAFGTGGGGGWDSWSGRDVLPWRAPELPVQQPMAQPVQPAPLMAWPAGAEVPIASGCCCCDGGTAVVVFAPCGHAAACTPCARALTSAAAAAQAPLRCPACRRVAAGTRAAGALF